MTNEAQRRQGGTHRLTSITIDAPFTPIETM
jgi:hypothetical protein